MDSRKRPQHLDDKFLLEAYTGGFFPMADPDSGEISWYSPDPRAILPLEEFHLSRSLKKVIRRKDYRIQINTRFGDVIRGCSKREKTWISDEIIRLYEVLHRRGFAHSVEAWDSGGLAGGLYGVAINGAFFGESMFSLRTNASKVALVHLVDRLAGRGFLLLDTQFQTEHLAGFGVTEVRRSEYLQLLKRALEFPASFT